MQYALSLLAAIAAVRASPMPFPQGVTAAIAPSGGMPSGCMANYNGNFGIAVMTGTAAAQATEAPDGQPAAASQISDGKEPAQESSVLLEVAFTNRFLDAQANPKPAW